MGGISALGNIRTDENDEAFTRAFLFSVWSDLVWREWSMETDGVDGMVARSRGMEGIGWDGME